MNKQDARLTLERRYVLFSCEGGAESVLMQRLIEGNRLCIRRERIVVDPQTFLPVTRCRKAEDIARRFFCADYAVEGAEGLLVARIVDSRSGKFVFPRKWENGTPVLSFFTRPEIEMLIIHNEGAFDAWERAKRKNHQLRPSEFCKQSLRFPDVKSPSFLDGYWSDVDDIVKSCRNYVRKRGKQQSDELAIYDLLA